ncbi:hypothetical protein GCM10029964_035650 [Kibdelosporangium lantanae]
MSTPMKVTVVPDRIQLRPGESADVELTVQNASQVVEHFAGSVVGLPSNDLFTCEPEVVKLRPREVGTLRMKISVPERGGLVAGPYTLGLVVKSPYSQEVSRCEELPLEVQPAPALTVNVQPEVATGGKVAHYGVNMVNDGNMPMAVTLSGTDPENRVGFKFAPREVRLEPGMAAAAQVTVNSDPPLTGQELRRMVTLRANAGDTTVEKQLTFVQQPRIKGGWMKFGALAAGLAVLGGMTFGGVKLLQQLKPQPPAPPVVIGQGPVGNTSQINPPPSSQQGQPSAPPPPSSGGGPVRWGQPVGWPVQRTGAARRAGRDRGERPERADQPVHQLRHRSHDQPAVGQPAEHPQRPLGEPGPDAEQRHLTRVDPGLPAGEAADHPLQQRRADPDQPRRRFRCHAGDLPADAAELVQFDPHPDVLHPADERAEGRFHRPAGRRLHRRVRVPGRHH